jgi:hypothetical protein
MSRLTTILVATAILALSTQVLSGVHAQNGAAPQLGDPPNAALINVSSPTERGMVTISGAPGAVFPNARLAIRNLYTEEIIYIESTSTGSFSADIFGPGNTPFWLSPTRNSVPREAQGIPGSLPGGPGTIIYGAFPEMRQPATPITQLVLDGRLADWDNYAQGSSGGSFLLRNRDSLYIATGGLPREAEQLRVIFRINNATYQLTLDIGDNRTPPEPAAENGDSADNGDNDENGADASPEPIIVPQSGALLRTAPDERDLGSLPMDIAVGENTVELRLHLLDIRNDSETAELREITTLDGDGETLSTRSFTAAFPIVDEVDGIVHLDSRLPAEPIRFVIGGAVAQGSGFWSARGRADRLDLSDTEQPLEFEFDVTMNTPELPPELVDLRLIGQVSLQPVVAQIGGGFSPIAGQTTNNGWSNLQTPSGLAIDDLRSDIFLGETIVEAAEVLQRDDTLRFALRFSLTLPDDLPDGLYVPIFQGFTQLRNTRIPWEATGHLGNGSNFGISRLTSTRLPLILNAGGVTDVRLPWALLFDHPSEGGRGILPDEDRESMALSGRVRYNSPTYILPPTDPEGAGYPIEPYLLNIMPNDYASTSAPIIPFLFPGGRLTARVTLPDGTVENLGNAPVAQNRLSTVALDERFQFGEQSPVDAYRLTTLNPSFTRFPFTQYGDYEIELTGNVEDAWGNRYLGGGRYAVLIAEQLDLTPGILPGTPFEVGDALSPVLTIAPAAPAEVTIRLRVFPLDGGDVRENVLVGQANRFGYFHTAEEILRFDVPGEYIIDYEVRYTDIDGRLWAGSLRGAGVIANSDSQIIAHGRRGSDSTDHPLSQAWFNTERYATVTGAEDDDLLPNAPYHSGDVAWLNDGRDGGLFPLMSVQDTGGNYQNWLLENDPNLAEQAARDELPLTLATSSETVYSPALAPDEIVNEAYNYFSVVRPGITLRQFVDGGDSDLALNLSMDDTYNQQIGAGADGDQPGDYMFLFGGAVIRNEAAEIMDTAIYGALATVIDPDLDPAAARVFPPYRGQTGGADGGALVFIRQEPRNMFFVPTAIQPGQTLVQGDTLSIAGQVAPTLPSRVSVSITAPSGVTREFDGFANAIGYFYMPEADFRVNEIGLWQVEITVQHEGLTSAGQVIEPLPTGGILSANGDSFSVYVVAQDAESLPWDRGADFLFPAASPFNYSFNVPEGWTDVQAYATLTMPGFIISDEPLQVTGRTFVFRYSPTAFNFDFPNFEFSGEIDAPAASDSLHLTLAVAGTDADGRFRLRSRSFTIFHDRMLSLE